MTSLVGSPARSWLRDGDSKMDVDVPLFHHDAVDHRAHETLAVFEAERGERAADASGKALDAQFKFGALQSHNMLTVSCFQADPQILPTLPE